MRSRRHTVMRLAVLVFPAAACGTGQAVGSTTDGSSRTDGPGFVTTSSSGGDSTDALMQGEASASDIGDAAEAQSSDSPSTADCPDLRGVYGPAGGGAGGPGCGTLYGSKGACVTQVGCVVTFQSQPAGVSSGGPVADGAPEFINGTATLQATGDFVGGHLVIGGGGTSYTNCTGTWNASTSVLSVVCGGADASTGCSMPFGRYAPPGPGCN